MLPWRRWSTQKDRGVEITLLIHPGHVVQGSTFTLGDLQGDNVIPCPQKRRGRKRQAETPICPDVKTWPVHHIPTWLVCGSGCLEIVEGLCVLPDIAVIGDPAGMAFIGDGSPRHSNCRRSRHSSYKRWVTQTQQL